MVLLPVANKSGNPWDSDPGSEDDSSDPEPRDSLERIESWQVELNHNQPVTKCLIYVFCTSASILRGYIAIRPLL